MITVGDARKLLLRGMSGPSRSGMGDPTGAVTATSADTGVDSAGNVYNIGMNSNTGSAYSYGEAVAPSDIGELQSAIAAAQQSATPASGSSSGPSLASLVATLAGAAAPIASIVTKKPVPAAAPKPAPAAPWTTGEKVLAGVVVVGVLGAGIAALVGGRKKNPPFSGTKRKVGPSGWHHKRGLFSYNPRKRR
jgi:hypothetical protein